MELGLAGKRVLITGASRGIGLDIARTMVAEGARVAFCARGGEGVATAAASLGEGAIGRAFDVRDASALASWVGDVATEYGGIDVVISNVSTRVDTKQHNWWQDTFDADLMQHIRLKELVEPHLTRGSSLVFIASIASVMTTLPPYEIAYGAMKAGLVNLVGQWAAIMGPSGIRVNAVSPGPIDFPGGWWDGVKKANPAAYERAGSLSALGRFGRPEEIAAAVTFLASERAAYITGANLRIDGGLIRTTNF